MKKITLLSTLITVLCAVVQLNAATFTATSIGGNWSLATTWTVVGSDADGLPDADDDVVIGSSFTSPTMSLDNINLTIASLTVNRGTLNSAGNLTVTGNFTWIAGNIGSFATSSTLTVGGVGNINLTISSFLINTTFTWSGGGSFSGFLSSNNSIINIPSGATVNASSLFTITAFAGSGSTVNMAGTLNSSTLSFGVFIDFNCTGTLTVDAARLITFFSGISNLNSHTGFAAGSTLSISGATVSLGVNFTAIPNFNLQVQNGSVQVNAVGGLNFLSTTLANNGTITGNPINFNGTTQQQLTGVGTTQTVNLNNPSGLLIPDAHNINNLNFLNGKVQLNTANLTIGSTITGADANRYVKTNSTGNLKRVVGTTDVFFPIGESNYTPVTVNQSSGTDTYLARVSDGIDAAHPLLGTQFIGKEWDISRSSGNATPATVKMEWNPSDVGVGYTTAAAQMLHYNSSITNWEPLPIGNRSASTANSITQTGVTNFSPFAVGLPVFVLPVELLSFKGTPQYKTSFLTWETAVEQNTAHFDIESSADGKIFSKIGNQKAKGQGSSYNFTDEGPLSITTYYRLKMVENDGSFSYSKIISVAFGKDLTVKAFPNPVQNELTIDVMSDAKNVEIEVIDVLGRSIYQKNESNTEGSKLLTINTLDWLSGIYFLKVSDGKKVFQQKIVKR
jgi:Secretion system C-terminal sorting domain